ncbi:MAG: IS21-like element helper ATPase IstB [Candidatus Sericytochromatia bacterium]
MAKDRPMQPTTLDELRAHLKALKLQAMLDALDGAIEEANALQQGYVTFLAGLVAKELLARTDKASDNRIKKAAFPQLKTFDTFDWTFQPELDVRLVKDLQNLQFIPKGRCVMVLGKPGTGKSHIAIAYGVLACARDYSVIYYTGVKLLTDLYATLADGSTDKFIAKLARADLLIIDDLRGPSQPRSEYANLMFDLVEARYQRKATILTSNLAIREWGKVLGSAPLTAAIVDRLMEGAHVINIRKGRSYRTEGPDAPPPEERQGLPLPEPEDEP